MCPDSIQASCRRSSQLEFSDCEGKSAKWSCVRATILCAGLYDLLFSANAGNNDVPKGVRRRRKTNLELESVENLYPFVWTEDQEHLRREIREFAAREIAPNVMTWDEASEFPMAVVKKLGTMGLLGVIFPPEYGGAGLGYVDYVLAIEELSAVDGSVGLTLAAHN